MKPLFLNPPTFEDFDGGAGEISHNRFDKCGDEAIDLDEDSHVQVFANSIVDSKDALNRMKGDLSAKTADN